MSEQWSGKLRGDTDGEPVAVFMPLTHSKKKTSINRASDKCQREKRKTINGDDLLWAMMTLGFEDYVEPLKLYLSKYRETEVRLTRGLLGFMSCPTSMHTHTDD